MDTTTKSGCQADGGASGVQVQASKISSGAVSGIGKSGVTAGKHGPALPNIADRFAAALGAGPPTRIPRHQQL
jgi:hypothetical protein